MTDATDRQHVPAPLPPRGDHALPRLAGILYLVIILTGISSEVFIRSNLIVPGDANVTAGNILAAQTLFRMGFVFDSVMLIADIAIAVVFYFIFRSVSNILSLTAAAFRLIQAAILGFNLLNLVAVLWLLNGAVYLAHLEGRDLHALVMLLLDMHGHGYDLGLIFFGISNLILGYLVIRSGKIPRLLGYGLIGAALVYLMGGYTRFLVPAFSAQIQAAYLIPLIAELSFCLWLLLRGARLQQ